MAAITMIESGKVEAGTVYVIPRTDNSAFTHNDHAGGLSHFYHFETRAVRASFVRLACLNRLTSGRIRTYIPTRRDRRFPGSEMRNINRGAYPGVKDGTLTEQIAYAITNMINTLDIDMEMDLREASPEYPTITQPSRPGRERA